MVFSTPVFLFFFLTATLIIYYIVPRKLRNATLFIASLLFYFWGERIYTVIMLISTVIDYTHGRLVEYFKSKGNDKAAKGAVASSMVLNLGLLFFFKYWDFIAASLNNIGLSFVPVLGIHLPIGISFYTFQTMSYTVDVYRGDTRAQRNIVNFGTFVTLFPQLIAGPIIKYKDLGEQIDWRDLSVSKFSEGVTVFVIGLAKKLLIANNIGQLWDVCKGSVGNLSVLGAWLGVIAFTFQIYFDFSGYSDMATGLGKMLGFDFLANFNYPYISKSITDFWRRWHISLSSWFREYLYIPLGGNRCGKAKWIRNIFLVWAATGLWHGASWNYLLWGLYFCVILIIEKFFLGKYIEKLPSALQHIYALFFIVLGWAIFGIEEFASLKIYLASMFGIGVPLVSSDMLYYLRDYLPVIIIAAAASLPVWKKLFGKLPEKAGGIVKCVLIAAALVLCTACLVADTYNPFLYFRF